MVFLDLPENMAINAVYPTALVLTIDLTCSERVQSKYQRVVALRQRVLYAEAPFAYFHPFASRRDISFGMACQHQADCTCLAVREGAF